MRLIWILFLRLRVPLAFWTSKASLALAKLSNLLMPEEYLETLSPYECFVRASDEISRVSSGAEVGNFTQLQDLPPVRPRPGLFRNEWQCIALLCCFGLASTSSPKP